MNSCVHSILKCGECRALDPKPPTIEQLQAQIDAMRAAQAQPVSPLRLDLGCGNTTRRGLSGKTLATGWTGVDFKGVEGADVFCDLAKERWPFTDSSVDEVHCSHMLEHVPRLERTHFFNELHRVLKPGAKATIITPHWASCRAYGDITHEWPPISEMFWGYLSKEWRTANAPHVPFACDFDVGYGYLTAAWLVGRSPEYVQDALSKYKEAAQDMMATVTAKK